MINDSLWIKQNEVVAIERFEPFTLIALASKLALPKPNECYAK
jgi:hypothetical protein